MREQAPKAPPIWLILAIALVGWLLPIPVVAEAWLPGPNLGWARYHFAFLKLASGDWLAIGGVPLNGSFCAEVERYSFSRQAFIQATRVPQVYRGSQQGIVLQDGRILVAGEHPGGLPNLAHIYDPATNAWWQSRGQAHLNRFEAAMALLPDGQVLYAGGYIGGWGPTFDSAEIFDPVSDGFRNTGSMAAKRAALALTVIDRGPRAGHVLVTGGTVRMGLAVEARCEIYDPKQGAFTFTGSLAEGRAHHQATLLKDGRILVTGGRTHGDSSASLRSAEIFDPILGKWSPTQAMAVPRARHTATLLRDGRVLVVGGARFGTQGSVTDSVEIFDPISETWQDLAPLRVSRAAHSAALLRDGRVLVAGGRDNNEALASSEILDWKTSRPPPKPIRVESEEVPSAKPNSTSVLPKAQTSVLPKAQISPPREPPTPKPPPKKSFFDALWAHLTSLDKEEAQAYITLIVLLFSALAWAAWRRSGDRFMEGIDDWIKTIDQATIVFRILFVLYAIYLGVNQDYEHLTFLIVIIFIFVAWIAASILRVALIVLAVLLKLCQAFLLVEPKPKVRSPPDETTD